MTSKSLEPVPWLKPLSWVYRLGVAARNATIDWGLRKSRKLTVPVISIGNLSVGGTGKTPFVTLLIERMRAAGLRVAVLARGYGRRDGEELNDEGRMLLGRFPGLIQAQSPKRYEAGVEMLARHEVDVILLDDGFQHRMLQRDLDVCLVDARDPFGGGLLPSGYSREPRSALRRADVCVLTSADSVEPAQLESLREEIVRASGGKPCYAVRTVAKDLLHLPEGRVSDVESLSGKRVIALAGIARPERFVETLQRLGADVIDSSFVRDHAEIPRELFDAKARAAESQNAILVVTEKDEARTARHDEGPARCVLRIDSAFLPGEDPGLKPFLPASSTGARNDSH